MVDPTLKGSHEFAEGLDDPFRVVVSGVARIRGRRFALPPAITVSGLQPADADAGKNQTIGNPCWRNQGICIGPLGRGFLPSRNQGRRGARFLAGQPVSSSQGGRISMERSCEGGLVAIRLGDLPIKG